MPASSFETNRLFFERVLEKGKLGHAYLFEGPAGSGKLDLALDLAQSLFCKPAGQGFKACGQCSSCRRIKSGHHPDLIQLATDQASLKVDAIRQLTSRLSKTAMEDQGMVVIIESAEKMTASASNALLKILEDPPPSTLFLLLTQAKNRILPTILSRCQVIHFQAKPVRARFERFSQVIENKNMALVLAYISPDIDQASSWAEDEDFIAMVDQVERFYHYIQERSDWAFPYIQMELAAYTDRDQQALILDLLLTFFRMDLYQKVQELDREDSMPGPLHLDGGQAIHHVLQAIRMFDSHVPFQAVLEHVCLVCQRLD